MTEFIISSVAGFIGGLFMAAIVIIGIAYIASRQIEDYCKNGER